MPRMTSNPTGWPGLRCSTAIGALAATVALAQPAAAQIPTSENLVVIANTDLFASCKADHVASQPGTNFPNTHIEPNLAINPAAPKNMLVGYQLDRWTNGGSRGMAGAYSMNGGLSWSPTTTPNVTQCQRGTWPRSSDPWVSFSPDGTAYYSQLTTEALENPNVFGRSGQTVSQSTDGGVTWYPPTTLIDSPAELDDTKPQILNDKNSLFADPKYSKLAYVVWDQLTGFTPGFGVTDDGHQTDPDEGPDAKIAAAPSAMPKDGVALTHRLREAARKRVRSLAFSADKAAAAYPTFVTGPTWFSRTTDHGYTWEPSHIIYDPGSNNQTIGNQVVRLPDGRLADFFVQINDLTGASTIGYVASDNNGRTWGKPYFPQVQVNTQAVTPNKQEAIRSADILFSVAVDNVNGAIYLAWEDTRFSGVNETAVAFSFDGYSWTSPIQVNQTPRNPSHPLFQQALIPTVVTTADGTAVVTYYDFRRDQVGAVTDNADVWAVTCNVFVSPDLCQSRYDWHREVKLTLAPFNFNDAPVAEGHFVGDYMGLKAVGQKVWPVFGEATGLNVTTLFTRPINVPVYNPTVAKQVASAH